MTILKRLGIVALIVCVYASCTPAALANIPYDNYNYSTKNATVLPGPAAVLPVRELYGQELGVGEFSSPADIFAAPDGLIYIADSGNNRIVVLDKDYETVRIIDSVDDGGVISYLKGPNGVYASEGGDVYIADTQNQRVIRVSPDGKLLQTFTRPIADFLDEKFIFNPIRVASDNAGRVYVIGRGTVYGVMQYRADGTFSGFIGANRVRPSLWDLFWKSIASREQTDFLQSGLVPIDFTSLAIDKNGFLYTTTYGSERSYVKRLNAQGIDVIRNTSMTELVGDYGDIWASSGISGSSIFVDVCLGENGRFICLDRVRGRVFTYDKDCNLLYVFGGRGDRTGLFLDPSGITLAGDCFLVADRTKGTVTVFELTEYAKRINQALDFHSEGKYEEATAEWLWLLGQNCNLELAHIGVGKALLQQGDYKGAMEEFRLGNHKSYYSRAFKSYRKEVIRQNYGVFIGIVAALAAVVAIYINRGKAIKALIRRRKLWN